MVDRDLVQRRLSLLDTYLEQLAPYRAIDQSAYEQDWKTQRVVERTLHLAIETCMDVADHIVSDRRLRVPETGAESFEILAEAQLISRELGGALALMVGSATSWSTITPDWTSRSFRSFMKTMTRQTEHWSPLQTSTRWQCLLSLLMKR